MPMHDQDPEPPPEQERGDADGRESTATTPALDDVEADFDTVEAVLAAIEEGDLDRAEGMVTSLDRTNTGGAATVDDVEQGSRTGPPESS